MLSPATLTEVVFVIRFETSSREQPAIGVKTCTLNVNLFSGARTALPNVNPFLTVRNGNQQNVPLPKNGFVSSSQISVYGSAVLR